MCVFCVFVLTKYPSNVVVSTHGYNVKFIFIYKFNAEFQNFTIYIICYSLNGWQRQIDAAVKSPKK